MRVRHAISRPHACLLVTCHLKPRFPDSILPHPQHLKHAAGRILRKIHRTNCDGIAAINPAVSSRAEIARRDRAPRSRRDRTVNGTPMRLSGAGSAGFSSLYSRMSCSLLAPKLSVDLSMIFVYVSFICDGTSAIIGYLRRGSAEMSPRRDLRDEQVDHDHGGEECVHVDEDGHELRPVHKAAIRPSNVLRYYC